MQEGRSLTAAKVVCQEGQDHSSSSQPMPCQAELMRLHCSVLLADIPGHERLRHQLDQYLKKAAAVVFVVDAADITPHKVGGGSISDLFAEKAH